MAKAKAEVLVTQSLVERLAHVERWPVTQQPAWPTTRRAAETWYREALRRDLNWLLNTRRPLLPELEKYPLAATTVVNYGLPDFQEFNGSEGRDKNALSAALLRAIRTFEPRIKQPRVFMVRSEALSRSLRFQIEGEIAFENMQEPIAFDTVYELISGDFEVK